MVDNALLSYLLVSLIPLGNLGKNRGRLFAGEFSGFFGPFLFVMPADWTAEFDQLGSHDESWNYAMHCIRTAFSRRYVE
jgi:hypothetical protein